MKFIFDPRFGIAMNRITPALRGWPWCLIGGRAVEVWTNPPQTPDIDLLVRTKDDTEIEKIAEALGAHSIQQAAPVERGDPHAKFVTFAQKSAVEVDLLVACDDLHFQVIRRAPRKTINGVSFPVAFAEDIVILKSQCLVDLGRPKDKKVRDRRAIRDIASSVDLSKDYIVGTLRAYGWWDELAYLRLMKIT